MSFVRFQSVRWLKKRKKRKKQPFCVIFFCHTAIFMTWRHEWDPGFLPNWVWKRMEKIFWFVTMEKKINFQTWCFDIHSDNILFKIGSFTINYYSAYLTWVCHSEKLSQKQSGNWNWKLHRNLGDPTQKEERT